tara:strand:- start:1278 stop:1850 length:573 start_codon:yes stop_codon:yes gene_type:complete
MTLSSDQWQLIEDKYGMLMRKICHKISGDKALASYEDNLQDLQISALEAVTGYEKQHEGKNGKFDEFWGSKGFDQYIKTVLWNHKNSKGKNISKRYHINRDTVSANENQEVIMMQDEKSNSNDLTHFFDEMRDVLEGSQSDILRELVKCPDLIRKNGKVNVHSLARKVGETVYETKKQLDGISWRLSNEL